MSTFISHSFAQRADKVTATPTSTNQYTRMFGTDTTHAATPLRIPTNDPCRSMGHGLDRTRSRKRKIFNLAQFRRLAANKVSTVFTVSTDGHVQFLRWQRQSLRYLGLVIESPAPLSLTSGYDNDFSSFSWRADSIRFFPRRDYCLHVLSLAVYCLLFGVYSMLYECI